MAFIAQELLIHAHSEQETFYKALEASETTAEEALHGKKEHQEIEDQINLILDSKVFGAPWEKEVEQLKGMVDHHVKEEENTIFKKAKKILSDDEAYALKEKMHYLKRKLVKTMEKTT